MSSGSSSSERGSDLARSAWSWCHVGACGVLGLTALYVTIRRGYH